MSRLNLRNRSNSSLNRNNSNRNNAADRYADDFRWLPDLHSFDFYPEGYELNRVTGPRLAVHAGTFYTRTRSKSTFKLVNAGLIGCDDELYDFGHIALNLATAITAPSNVLLLDTNDDPLYTFETGNKYQIVFKNECESCPHSPSTDFHIVILNTNTIVLEEYFHVRHNFASILSSWKTKSNGSNEAEN